VKRVSHYFQLGFTKYAWNAIFKYKLPRQAYESDLRNGALNKKALPQLIFTVDYKVSKGPASGYPNYRKCRARFLGLNLLIRALRERVYRGERDAPCFNRKQNLRSILCLGCRGGEEGRTVGFSLGGVSVCKTFVSDCVGIRRQYSMRFSTQCLPTSTHSGNRRKQWKLVPSIALSCCKFLLLWIEIWNQGRQIKIPDGHRKRFPFDRLGRMYLRIFHGIYEQCRNLQPQSLLLHQTHLQAALWQEPQTEER